MSINFHDDIDFLVCVVLVGTGPVLWAVECEICDELLNEGTTDEAEVGRLDFSHKALHSGMSVADYKLSTRRRRREKNGKRS